MTGFAFMVRRWPKSKRRASSTAAVVWPEGRARLAFHPLSASLSLIQSPGRVRLENPPNFVPDPAKDLHLFCLGPGGVRGIVKSPMMPAYLSGEHRASLVSVP